MKNESKNPVVHALLLAGIALVAAVFLIIGNIATKLSIELREYEDLEHSLAIVIPARLYDNDLTKDITHAVDTKGEQQKVHRARLNGKVTAVAFERFVNAYAKVHLIMAIDARGRILGVRVLAHQETPGLGDKIEVAKSDWIKGFDGLSLKNTPREKWGVKKDGGIFDQFSGATITPRAVVKSVHQGMRFFRLNKEALLSGKDQIAPDSEALSTNKGGAGS